MKEKALFLFSEGKYTELSHLLCELEPADIAALLGEVPDEVMSVIFRILPKDTAAEVFVEMDSDEQELLITAFSDRELSEVLSRLYMDDTVDIIEEMPANVVRRILSAADSSKRQTINELLKYPPDSAGSIMTTEYVGLKKNMTVSEAFLRIKNIGINKETIYTCYVTDTDKRLIGVITAKELMLSEQKTLIGSLMERNVISVSTDTDKEEVVKQIKKYDLLALPVVDKENRLVGIVTVDDAIDVMQDETEEDFAKMAAVTPIEDSYLKTSVFTHAKKRILWLLILMISATVTGAILTKYETAFAAIPLLVSFIPMLMDTGGNSGSQSSILIIRGMAIDEIKLSDFFRVWFKELRIGLLVGTALAAVNGIRILIMYRDFAQQGMLILVLSLTIIAVVVLAKTLGCVLPMLAKVLHLDPAIMASPMLTTVVDTCAVLIYFNIAIKLLM